MSSGGLGGFESEFDIEERRKKRQEEWEKVRTADQPEDAPEEPFDGRSLYDRLKEQRDAKQEEFEEARKFKNMIRGLDDDDVDHLHEVDTRKVEQERQQKEEELKELNDYRTRVQELQEQSAEQKLAQIVSTKPKPKDSTQTRTSQKAILSSVVKRKSQTQIQEPPQKQQIVLQQPSALKCIAILPGIGDYKSSDESDGSSELEEFVSGKMDLTGRQIRKRKECDE